MLAQECHAGEFQPPLFQPAQPVKPALFGGFPTEKQLYDSVVAMIQDEEHTVASLEQELVYQELSPAYQKRLQIEFAHILQRPYTDPIGPQRPVEERPTKQIVAPSRRKHALTTVKHTAGHFIGHWGREEVKM